jgi:RNA polymerase sigma-70 factor (ECF subfamily)
VTTSPDLQTQLGAFRPDLLRHCYRMLGSFAEAEDLVQEVLLRAWRARDTYAGDAPVSHWLMRIATNACLTALAQRRRRELPQLEHEPVEVGAPSVDLPSSHWITPASDARLFPSPATAAETRESVAIAFIALLQRLPPRQRAVLLLKDVVGWSADEIASGLGLSLPSVNSALHRARRTIAIEPARADEPEPELLRAYVRSWEERDVDALVALLRQDVVFAMPPRAIWFRGADAVARFVATPRFAAFLARGLRVQLARANGLPALAFYAIGPAGGPPRRHSIQLVRFVAGQVAEATTFIGEDYLRGFDLAETFDRTVSGGG